jgi:hypothetical protein
MRGWQSVDLHLVRAGAWRFGCAGVEMAGAGGLVSTGGAARRGEILYREKECLSRPKR